jgi:hypothetical protein
VCVATMTIPWASASRTGREHHGPFG